MRGSITAVLTLCALVLATTSLWAADSPTMVSGKSIYNDTSPPLRSIAVRTAMPTGLSLEVPIRVRPGTEKRVSPDQGPDPLRQLDARPFGGAEATPAPTLSVEGLDEIDNQNVVGSAIVPPDTNGDVGIQYYVQWINLVWGVFDKNTGALVGGPFAGNSFWVGFRGFCESNNDGDPIVQFDDNAGRWMVSQFSINQGIQCVAVSTTSDPLGSYHRYAFEVTPGGQNDYPKMGVWDDGTTNSTGQSAYTFTMRDFGVTGFIGEGVMERDAMLVGNPAQFIKFQMACAGNDCREGTLPAHLDGPPVAADTCPTFFGYFDAQFDDGPSLVDGVRSDKICVDWNNIGNTTWSENAFVPGASFDRALGNGFADCISPVLGGEALDCLAIFTMHPAQVRQQDGYCSVVLATTVDVGGDVGGVRWGELRSSDCETGWTFHQEGTYSPDGNDRWMGSIAMDGAGNIALGYSESSGSMFPAVSYTTRTAADPPGMMPGGEETCFQGTGAQVSSANRWGDYSRMSVDPVNACTFWYTQEYYETTSSFDFKTRICSFSLPGCGTGGPVCGNGICELDEDCTTCAEDCPSGGNPLCGNGICEPGEDCTSCAADCNGQQKGNPANRFCCSGTPGGVGGPNPVDCSDSRCTTGGFSCSEVAEQFCCGDGFCDGLSECDVCGIDCSTDPICEVPGLCVPGAGLGQKGDACTSDEECASCKCKGGQNKTCK